MQPARGITRRGGQFGLRDFQRPGPELFVGTKDPTRFQYGGMVLVRRRNQIQFPLRFGSATESQPADGGVEVM